MTDLGSLQQDAEAGIWTLGQGIPGLGTPELCLGVGKQIQVANCRGISWPWHPGNLAPFYIGHADKA